VFTEEGTGPKNRRGPDPRTAALLLTAISSARSACASNRIPPTTHALKPLKPFTAHSVRHHAAIIHV